MEELATLTRALVEIPSHEDPTAAGDRIEQWLDSETDATVQRDDVGNVIARRGTVDSAAPVGTGAGPTLALVGHHDVVPPDDTQVDDQGYTSERRDGRIYGRGAADMKGAVAASMLAFRDADLADTPVEIVFASFVGEEIGGEGARHAIDRGFEPDYAVVGEGSTGYSAPDTTDVAVAHKGRRATTVVASGESAHASVPAEGTNAIYRACEAIERLRELPIQSVEVGDDVVEGSLVVTQIDGGTAWNVVPDECRVTVDERTVPGERVPIETVETLQGVTVTVDQDLPPMRCADEAFVDLVLQAARDHHGSDGTQHGLDEPPHGAERTPQRVAKPHATDAGWLSQAGTECVVCGPSEPGEAHTATESVSVAVLERCYRIYRSVAERFPRSLS